MKGKRTGLEFENHIYTEQTYSTEDGPHMNVCTLKKPDTGCDLVRFIVGHGITVATGDYGEWVFDREFTPSGKGGVSDGYWKEKLCKHDSGASGEEFDPEGTREEIVEQLTPAWQEENLGREWTEEETEYLNECIDATQDGCTFAYEYVAYRNNVGWFEDGESVPFVTKTKTGLLYVFDAFDEMCRRLKEDSLDIPIECKDNKEYSPSLEAGEGCEQCGHRNFAMVGHPGGSGVHSVEQYFCEKGFWKDEF